ncbi:aldehyde dehydrogenase [Nocardia caishijiensis]|uniref:Betaine-aldehyde dehydrogenase n=1 Tax=Nocardia caishijiensis TaxID=184756 RepID=A0ABQ6YLD2_9NOCA|nr:aldehyde dehydrogenase [Nocardia caishijiensis]KAF0846609.1 betaine-aldehyde dehydrogenase [Nocardia caishijiensis]
MTKSVAAGVLPAHPEASYIDGNWVPVSSSETFEVVNCSTEEVVTAVGAASVEDVDAAVRAARKAFDTGPWPLLSPAERAGYLRAIAAELTRRGDDFARLWSIESGIVYSLAKTRLPLFLSGAFNAYADLAETFPFRESHTPAAGGSGLLVREPVGVVAAIVPWNGPAGLMAYKCAPALLAGCSIVLKPPQEAPTSAYLFAEICDQVGLPPGVINVVTADRQVSETLVRHPGVDKVTFTGSTVAGRTIGAICADRMARCTLELGGKSPALVLDDYDIGTAATVLAGGISYLAGQVCHSLTRVIVSEKRHDELVDALGAAMSAVRVGDPFEEGVTMGPLASARQRERVESFIAAGKADGARLVTGGGRPAGLDRGFFVEPTVFAGVDNRSVIATEEIFGPVLAVIAAKDEDDAVALANDNPYGLNAAVFTNDTDRAYRVARKLRTGTVGQNGPRTDFSIAFGGFKLSGVGREGGSEGLLPFLETKTLVLENEPADIPGLGN